MLPQVSFVIPCYNERAYLAQCLASITRQEGGAVSEIIVVDNGSTDGTAELAASLGARVLFNPRKGAAASRNLGAREAQGTLLAFVDADCLLDPWWLSTLSSHLAGGGAAAAAAPVVPSPKGMTWVEQAWSAAFVLSRSQGEVTAVSALGSSNLLMTKENFLAAGAFDERLLSCEDYDLSQRLRQHGALLLAKRTKVVHLRESKTIRELFGREVGRGRYSLRCFMKNGFRLRELPSTAIPCTAVIVAGLLFLSLAQGQILLALASLALLVALPLLYLARRRQLLHGSRRSLQHYAVAATYVAARSVALIRELLDICLPAKRS